MDEILAPRPEERLAPADLDSVYQGDRPKKRVKVQFG